MQQAFRRSAREYFLDTPGFRSLSAEQEGSQLSKGRWHFPRHLIE